MVRIVAVAHAVRAADAAASATTLVAPGAPSTGGLAAVPARVDLPNHRHQVARVRSGPRSLAVRRSLWSGVA
eukprot:1882866-Alexandrium_andersonii.AAC.1